MILAFPGYLQAIPKNKKKLQSILLARNSDAAPNYKYMFGPHRGLITKTCLYNFDPLKPHFYIVKLGFTGAYIIFLISSQKHRLWVRVRTASSRRF